MEISHKLVIPSVVALPLMPCGVNDEGSGFSLPQLMLSWEMLSGECRCDCQEDKALPSPSYPFMVCGLMGE